MKMLERQNAYFLVVFILFIIRDGIFSKHMEGVAVFMHCTQTATDRMASTPKIIIPEPINASTEPLSVAETGHLRLDLCPNRRFLKISWISSQTHERNTTLCYKMESAKNEMLKDTVCFFLPVYWSNHSSAMNCWFPTENIDKEPIITAWVHQSVPTSQWSVSGSLNTSALDPVNSCTDICEIVPMNIGSQINCQDTTSIVYNMSTVVQHLSFDAIDKTSCENDIIHISRQTDNRLEYQLTCGYHGLGYVKVLYQTHGKYCLKYQLVRVHCPNAISGNSTRRSPASDPGNIHSFGTFMIFGVVCTVVITAMFFSTIFVVQWFMYLRITYFKHHMGSVTESRNASICVEDSVPLNTNKSEITECSLTDRSIKKHSPRLSRKSSRRRLSSTTFTRTPEKTIKDRGSNVRTMRKSVTMALLEDTDPFYKKKILFLPKPFDTFTHEVTKRLKSVFENEVGVLSQCCYDRSVYKHYMTGDRHKWIENVLGDHDKILIFLCFTSLSTECVAGKYETMVEEILDYLVLSKVKSPRLCKVLFLYLTDSSKNVQKKHCGDVFHISNSDSYKYFLCDVLNYCVRNLDEYPDFVFKILNCKASKVFLRYIGIRERKTETEKRKQNSPPCLLE
ncbi:uncharacterized protein LOC123537951 isoform X3 [Mercenaria mercenaria]|uniref:uncharacterized protein LOC123537951 isoform X3 n=1 Tax=Mercenaria mercenaria TaxID=6596 RepID=UPI00234ED1F8|nr:uncharacterized protein LOC123537951 isoform X3 [Mercenaria mercenaria]